MAATGKSPLDDLDDGARCFPFSCLLLLQPPSSYVAKPKALVANQGDHVNITIHMRVAKQDYRVNTITYRMPTELLHEWSRS
jgi:hypothetical protein